MKYIAFLMPLSLSLLICTGMSSNRLSDCYNSILTNYICKSHYAEIILPCFNNDEIIIIKKTCSIDDAYHKYHLDMKKAFGNSFNDVDEEGWRDIFATIVAANFAEYGNSSAVTFDTISDLSH